MRPAAVNRTLRALGEAMDERRLPNPLRRPKPVPALPRPPGEASEAPVLASEPGVTSEILPSGTQASSRELTRVGLPGLPTLIAAAGESATRRFLEFFTATIRNRNTRLAYAKACGHFLSWCEERGVRRLQDIEPMMVAAYVEYLGKSAREGGLERSAPTVKQHLAAVRMLFDWLVTGQVLQTNPAHAVRGPKHVVTRGKTPVLTADQARQLLDSIPLVRKDGTPDLAGLRDRALIGVMVYSFARVSAAAGMRVEDFYQEGTRWKIRLHEKGGKRHMVPAHHNALAYLDEYLAAAGVAGEKKSPLFRSIDRERRVTERGMTRNDVLRMVKRRARVAGLPASTSCHTFRATGITAYLENGGDLENAQAIAAHSSPRTTKLYDRTSDEITLDEVERIRI
jgi:site-specific recombinase XerD